MSIIARSGRAEAWPILKVVFGAPAAWKGCFLQGDLAVSSGIATAAMDVGTFKLVDVPYWRNLAHMTAYRDAPILQSNMNSDRPRIVFDCSKVSVMDKSAIHVLLCCLEEAIKRNGDVKLAAVPMGARAALELAGVDRLFEIFDTDAEAINSFRRFTVYAASTECAPGSPPSVSEDAR